MKLTFLPFALALVTGASASGLRKTRVLALNEDASDIADTDGDMEDGEEMMKPHTSSNPGACYDTQVHQCDCTADRCSAAKCETAGAIWTAECPNHCTECADDGEEAMMDMTNVTSIVDVVMGALDEEYGTLVAAVKAAGLAEALSSEGPFTLFAPSDVAFAKINNETLAQLLEPEWATHLADILSYHVIMGESVMSSDLKEGLLSVEMGNGEIANITLKKAKAAINDMMISSVDMKADNGVVHGIHSVLMPSWMGVDVIGAAASMPDIFSTLSEAIAFSNMTEILEGGPFTVFAPTNEAWEKLDNKTLADFFGSVEGGFNLADTLAYHVFPGIVTLDGLGELINAPKPEYDDQTYISMANGMFSALSMMSATSMVYDTNSTMNSTMMGEDGDVDVVASAFEEPMIEYMINGHRIISGDILVNNGIIHIIDGVNGPVYVRK